jgi:hypothetical protein
MNESGKSVPMEGHGRYNRASQVQAGGLAPAVPMFSIAAGQVPLPGTGQPLILADYGSSQGHNSLVPMGEAIRILRERVGSRTEITVVHVDLPGNDFTSLFETLRNDPQSYLRNDSAAFALAAGQSFYEQVLPSQSVTLGWSSWAVQWLSQAPGRIPGQVQVALSPDRAAKDAFHRQAADDWRRFLVARGRELRPGAQLVVLTMAARDDGEFGYRALLEVMYASLLQMVAGGLLREQELQRMVIPTVGRTRQEFLAPFQAEDNFAGLRLEEAEVFFGEDHIRQDYERDGNVASFGARWAAFCRTSVFPSLAAALEDGGPERRAEFMDQLESRIAAQMAARPEAMVIPLARIRIVKS